MSQPDIDSATGLQPARPRQAARIFGRALLLRCPNCGGGPVLRHWLKMRETCGQCGIRLDRGESDYFIGSMMFNLALGEALFALVFVGVLLASAPHVPWDTLSWAIPVMVVAFPVLCFPFSKLTWLAFDLIMRPMTARELEWHRTGTPPTGLHGPPRHDAPGDPRRPSGDA